MSDKGELLRLELGGEMNTKKKKKERENVDSKKVREVIKAFFELEKEEALFDELFKKVKTVYGSMEGDEKECLFRDTINKIEVSKSDIAPIASELLNCDQDDPLWASLLGELRNRSYSPRLKVFRNIARSPGGLKFLLDFRSDLLSIRRHSKIDLEPLDLDIVFLFELWFQGGFIYLEEITLDSSYKQIELIKNRDLVHPMSGIEEMGQRLGRDRRCFAMYHRLLPYEPIIFIEFALTEGIVRNMSDIIAGADNNNVKGKADTAIFYSINNTQNGLAGLGLGKILIGQVVDYIRKENEKIKNYFTLSPVPGFWDRYLRPLLEGKDANFSLKHTDIISFFSKKTVAKILFRAGDVEHDPDHFNASLVSLLSDETWAQDEELRKAFRNPLVKIAYHYVAREKNPRNKPLNPVAGFHLGNGATVSEKNINFLANPSSRGLRESCGIMVNYVYSSTWLNQIRQSFRRLDRMEIKGFFRR